MAQQQVITFDPDVGVPMGVNLTIFSGADFNTNFTIKTSVGSEFKDYEFSIDELPPFTKFQIKIDMIGTNQAEPPFIKDLRAIALA